MRKLSRASERVLLNAVQDVMAEVTDGSHPTRALSKVAREQNLSPNFVRLVANGYNTGAVNFQQEKHASALKKFASVPLADADAAIAEIWPQEIKAAGVLAKQSAVSDVYSSAPTGSVQLEKAASSVDVDALLDRYRTGVCIEPKTAEKILSVDLLQVLRRQSDEKRAAVAGATDAALLAFSKLAGYLKKEDRRKLPNTVAYLRAGVECLDKSAGWVLDQALAYAKIASVSPAVNKARVNFEIAPLSLLQDCVQAVEKLAGEKKAFADFDLQARTEAGKIASRFNRQPVKPPSVLKQANAFATGMVAKSLMDALGPVLMPSPAAAQDRVTKQLTDPSHETVLRQIQTQVLLNDLMRNDDVIKGYSSDEVSQAFNELAQLSPRTSSQPAVVRPWLRRRLTQGTVEPFEAAEMTNVENALSNASQPRGEVKTSHVLRRKSSVLR